jgi:hypothetical protein
MTYRYVLIAACVFVIVLYLLYDPRPGSRSSITRTAIERPDSALITIDKRSPEVRVNSKLTPRNGALTLDTILSGDTLQVSVTPDSTIQIRLLPAPRIMQGWVKFMRRDSVIYKREIERVYIERAWYESPLLVIAGAVLGFLLAILM